ncbi:MAG: glucose-6-phosphate isomerase [Nitrospirae bacterium]|nr:glucose-6-phosphate isomerase [Nitrospirota bacterium]
MQFLAPRRGFARMLEMHFGNMLEEVIGDKGLSLVEIEGIREKTAIAHSQIHERKWEELAFVDLVNQDTAKIKELAESIVKNSDLFLLLGIGGSAMGPRAILEALQPMHNFRNHPKIFIYDNIDPRTLDAIIEIIDPHRTTVNVVSKSGNTAETVASFMIFWEHMNKALGSEAARRFIITTNPEGGILRQIVRENNLMSLPIHPSIVGRYSVLSPAGLLLSEIAEINSDELLLGAKDILTKCSNAELWENPAYLFSVLLYLMCVKEKRTVNVMMPYADGLKSLSEWFCQLWAESLGKLGLGITPYPAVGTTDQHSQLQLWMEGPEDKVVIFIRIDDYGSNIRIPKVFETIEEFSLLSGQCLNDLIGAAAKSTELALSNASKPNMTITMPSLDAYHVGQLFMFFQICTTFMGFLFGVNPFNQPWIEAGKNNTFGLLGKRGFQKQKEDIARMAKGNICWKL